MAPQIFKGTYDESCDVWSLGIILFMLVTGEPPVNGQTYEVILKNIKDGKLNLHGNNSLNQVLNQKNLSPEVVDLIRKILVPQEQRISLKDIANHSWMSMKGQ